MFQMFRLDPEHITTHVMNALHPDQNQQGVASSVFNPTQPQQGVHITKFSTKSIHHQKSRH